MWHHGREGTQKSQIKDKDQRRPRTQPDTIQEVSPLQVFYNPKDIPKIAMRSCSMFWMLLSTSLPWGQSFSTPRIIMRTQSQLSLTREEYLQPHFEAPTATSVKSYDFDFERILECAKSVTGECPIDEMTQMMEELERFSAKSASSDSGGLHFSSDNDARQVVYHALQSQVELAMARSDLESVGLLEKVAEVQPPPPSARDLQDLFRQMRDIADHEEL